MGWLYVWLCDGAQLNAAAMCGADLHVGTAQSAFPPCA